MKPQKAGKINIVIPTLDRQGSLIRTVQSICQSGYKNFVITVVIDGNRDYFKKLRMTAQFERNRRTTLLFNPTRIGWGKSINRVLLETNDPFYFSASDDLGFNTNTLSWAMEAMKERFPDGDGVIGINQENMKHFCPGAFVLVGRKFVNRFPSCQLYNPIYDHFCVDSELWHYAESEQKFFFSKAASVHHRRFQDDCHRLAQKTLRKDREQWWKKKGHPELYWPRKMKA